MAASCSSVTDAPATVLWVSAATGGLLIVIALCVKMRTHARDVSRGTAVCSPNQSSASSQDHCLSDTNTCQRLVPKVEPEDVDRLPVYQMCCQGAHLPQPVTSLIRSAPASHSPEEATGSRGDFAVTWVRSRSAS